MFSTQKKREAEPKDYWSFCVFIVHRLECRGKVFARVSHPANRLDLGASEYSPDLIKKVIPRNSSNVRPCLETLRGIQ